MVTQVYLDPVEGGTTIPITPRHKEILSLLIKGHPIKRIAMIIGVAPGTIKCHMSEIKYRLGAESNIQAVAIAIKEEYIRCDP